MNDKAIRLIITGVVQGVGFRYYVKTKAAKLGLAGWTRNLPDGSVEVLAEGDSGLLETLVRELRLGPVHANVTGLTVEPVEFSGKFNQFEIRGW